MTKEKSATKTENLLGKWIYIDVETKNDRTDIFLIQKVNELIILSGFPSYIKRLVRDVYFSEIYDHMMFLEEQDTYVWNQYILINIQHATISFFVMY